MSDYSPAVVGAHGGWMIPLSRLLKRPITMVWIPLSVLASFTVMALVALAYWALAGPRGDSEIALWPMFSLLVGLLVGQAIKELQHCHFAWGLPRLRARLLPGTMVLGLLAALFSREIVLFCITLVSPLFAWIAGRAWDLGAIWRSLPTTSPALMVISFTAFWIGVRPSVANLVGIMAPLVALGPVLPEIVRGRALLVFALCAPLVAFLIYDTFSVHAARRRPFIPTQPLSGATWSGRPNRAPRGGLSRVIATSRWRFNHLGTSISRWVLAGWHENHGWSGRGSLSVALLVAGGAYLIVAGAVADTVFRAPSLWLRSGYGRMAQLPSYVVSSIDSIVIASMLLGVPLTVACLCYGSISLRRIAPYPLSRRQLAEVEYRGGLWETVVLCGFLTAILLGFWSLLMFVDSGFGSDRFVRWPLPVGGSNGWILALLRPLALMFVMAPIVQYYRLRHVRAPGPRNPVVQLLTVLALTGALTWAGTELAFLSIYLPSRYPLALNAAMFVTAAVISQYLYRRALERHFASADLA